MRRRRLTEEEEEESRRRRRRRIFPMAGTTHPVSTMRSSTQDDESTNAMQTTS
jgi:hypothetical protein